MAFEDNKSAHPIYREHDRLCDFVQDCCAEGRISREDENAVFNEFIRLTDNAGIVKLDLDDASLAVLRHATHQMRRKLLELHPELTEEVRGLGEGQGRSV